MKKLLLFAIILFNATLLLSQPIANRSSPAVTVSDARLRGILNMYAPHTHGLTLNNGLDTLGAFLYEDSSGHFWYRDTVLTGGHKWTMFAIGPPGGQDTIVIQNTPSGGGGIPRTRVSNDTAYVRKDFVINGLTADTITNPQGITYLLGGDLTKFTKVEGSRGTFSLFLDSLNQGLIQSVNNTDTSRYNVFTQNNGVALQANTQNDGSGSLVFTHTSHQILSQWFVNKTGSISYGQPSIQLFTLDSSITIKASRILIQNDTTLTSINSGLYINELPYNSSTTNMVGMGWNTVTGRVYSVPLGSGGGGGGGGIGLDSVQAVTSGTTVTQTSGFNIIQVNPSSPLASLAITTATTWHTSNYLLIVFGGTITSGAVVNSLSTIAGSGLIFIQSITPTGTFNAGDHILYKKIGSFLYRQP